MKRFGGPEALFGVQSDVEEELRDQLYCAQSHLFKLWRLSLLVWRDVVWCSVARCGVPLWWL